MYALLTRGYGLYSLSYWERAGVRVLKDPGNAPHPNPLPMGRASPCADTVAPEGTGPVCPGCALSGCESSRCEPGMITGLTTRRPSRTVQILKPQPSSTRLLPRVLGSMRYAVAGAATCSVPANAAAVLTCE